MAIDITKKPNVKNNFGKNGASRVNPMDVKSSGWPLGMSADEATPKPKILKISKIQSGALKNIKPGWF